MYSHMSEAYRFIYPLDDTNGSIGYAIEMARQSNAKLYLLFTYRLTDIHAGFIKPEGGSIKKSFDESIQEKLENEFGKLLKKEGVAYEFLVEIGFLPDRLIANVTEKNIDMILLNDLLKHREDGLMDRIREMPIPVLLIPAVGIQKDSTILHLASWYLSSFSNDPPHGLSVFHRLI